MLLTDRRSVIFFLSIPQPFESFFFLPVIFFFCLKKKKKKNICGIKSEDSLKWAWFLLLMEYQATKTSKALRYSLA